MCTAEIKIEPLIDPRGRQKRNIIKLASRVSLEDLKKGKVLFYDNTKLDFCNYREAFVRIKEHFKEAGISSFIDFKETVRGKTTRDLQNYALKLSKSKPTAAIVALGDMGTTPATTIVAIELEKLEIPCVYITASPGAELAEAVAFYRAGNLCLCPVDIYQGSTKEEVRTQIDKQIDCIFESLTLPPDKISKRSTINFELDKKAPAKNGLLNISEYISDSSRSKNSLEIMQDVFNDLHLGDGLPIIPPTQKRYDEMFSYCPYPPDEILVQEAGPTGRNITIKDVVVAAVMAGCNPQYMPVLVTAFRAMGDPKYNFLQSVTTSHPGGNLVLVSGPLAHELGIHGGAGCLGPGFPANATIGRAVNLVIINVCRSVPGISDLDCIASQAEYTYCFAENPELSPWPAVNEERYNKQTTTVLVLKAEPPHDIIDFLSQTGSDLLDTLVDCATTLGSNNAYVPGNLIYVLTPDHALLLNKEGFDKDKIRKHIHKRAYHQISMVRNRGLVPVRPAGFEKLHPMPVTRSEKDIEIVVAGGRGGHSAVILPWALHSESVVETVLLPDGKVPKNISEFKNKNY